LKGKSIRSYLLAGLVVWLPIIVTFVVLRFMIDLLDKSIALLPDAYRPEQLFGFHLPGFGVLFSLLLLFVTGLLVTNFLGQHFMRWGEAILDRIPLVRSIYSATKQVMETVFSSNSQAFRKVLLVEYPRKDMWTIAFQTGAANAEVIAHTGVEMMSIFVPTTPNPTSGFLMMVPKSDAKELSMSVDDALKLVISLGVVQTKH
jgi:uncharacterized membrane protein|tara:strand:+ start:85873 stop:86478 length:606 start_codon:yes stop_codon:yes gene_type:complete